MSFRFTLAVFLFTVTAFNVLAFDDKGSPGHLVNLEGDPSAFVNGTVNVISGDYCDVDTDIVVAVK